MPLVDYLVARDGLPRRSGLAYDYVLGGDGLFLLAENELLAVRVPVVRCTVRGLPSLSPSCVLKWGRMPPTLWQEIVAITRACALYEREVLAVVTWDNTLGYCLVVPPQVIS